MLDDSTTCPFDPDDPCDAQTILLEYLPVFESRLQHPERALPLPYPAATIEVALRTAMRALRAAGLMTDDVSAYLEMASWSLTQGDGSADGAAAGVDPSPPSPGPVSAP